MLCRRVGILNNHILRLLQNSNPTILNSSLIRRLEDVLSWLFVEGKRDATTVDINAIALLKQAIRSSPGRNTGTTSPESICGNSTGGCCEAGKHVDIVMDDEVLHKLVSMVEKNDLFEELMIAVVDTELNLTEFDSEQLMQEDLDIFHASFELHLHFLHID
ncbi:hypothetical protein Tco_0746621 [Tanacetum coccineum]